MGKLELSELESDTNCSVNDIPETFPTMEFGVDIRKLNI